LINLPRSKTEIVEAIAELLNLPETPKMSTGSTEPREIFDKVNEVLGLGLNDRLRTKPDMARGIVEAAGFPWLPSYESRGGTVTRAGLKAVLDSVRFFLNGAPMH
jgi:hypothetical protein